MARAQAELPAKPAGGSEPASASRGREAAIAERHREDLPQRIVAAKVSTATRMLEIWNCRELLVFLVRKELKVRYKNSFLGFLWSFLNPAMVLLIYFVMFRYILKNGTADFAVYLMCGLLPWNLFNTSLLSSAGTLVAHAGIVKKVAFPREILALAQVGVASCYFFFQTCILVLFLAGFRVMPDWQFLPVMLLALLCDLVFTSALALMLSALNVYMRDIEHLIQVVMVALFFAEPIVYTWTILGSRLARHHLVWVYLLNPLTPIVLSFQRFIYSNVPGALPGNCTANAPCGVLANYSQVFYLEMLGGVLAGSLLLFYLAMIVFRRVEGNFAEEL
ncbi:MAG: ABC transporter permease [Acidimicrobiales bacterium]